MDTTTLDPEVLAAVQEAMGKAQTTSMSPDVQSAVDEALGISSGGGEIRSQMPQYTNRMNLLKSVGPMMTAPLDQDATGDVIRRGVMGPLVAVGGVAQGIESTIAGPLVRGAESLMGKKFEGDKNNIYEFGDVPRALGVPEPISSGIGLVAAAVTDPVAIGTRVLAMAGGKKLGQVAGKALAHSISENPTMAQALIDDKGRALTKEYADRKSLLLNTNKLIKKNVAPVYQEASAAMDDAMEIAGKTTADTNVTLEAINLLKQYADNAIDTRQGALIDKALENALKGVETGRLPTVKDLVGIYRNLGRGVTRKPEIGAAEQALRDMLSKRYGFLKDANDKWATWKAAEESLERAGIKVAPYKKTLVLDKANITDMFTDATDLGWTRGMRGMSEMGDEGLEGILIRSGQDPKAVQEGIRDIERSVMAKKVFDRPTKDSGLLQKTSWLLSGRPEIGASVISAGLAQQQAIRGVPKMVRELLNPTTPTSLRQDIINGKFRRLGTENAVSPLGRFMWDATKRATGMGLSESASRAATMRLGTDQ